MPEGSHVFEVVADSLPEGVSAQGSVTRTVTAGRSNTVVFTFGEVRHSQDTPLYERIIRLSIDGLRFGLVIAVAAIGLSLIFGTTGLTNFAHGELVTLGAVFAWMFNVTMGMPLLAAAVLAIILGVAVGWLNNTAVWRPLRKRRVGLIPQLVVSIGLAISLRYLILMFFSDRTQAFADYPVNVQRSWGPIAITDVNLLTIAVSLVVLDRRRGHAAEDTDRQGDARGRRQQGSRRVIGHQRRAGDHVRLVPGLRAGRPRRCAARACRSWAAACSGRWASNCCC